MKKGLEEYTDAELFELLKSDKKRGEKAFSVLYARHSPRVYAYCRRFLGNREDAQDVFQETFIRFHASAEQDRVMTNMPAFLLKIARNLCVNLKRLERQDLTYEDYMYVPEDTSPDKSELLDLIKRAMELLTDDYREVFILREYEGMTYAEIAEITNESMANVKIRIFRAKQKIREILAPFLAEISKFE